MFKKLVNEAVLTFTLSISTPLLINGYIGGKIRAGYDMAPIVTYRNGEKTVYIPGSSAKGVFRTRYEQLAAVLSQGGSAKSPCNIAKTAPGERCVKSASGTGTQRYQESCLACRLFGNTSLGSRIQFADAYPIDKPVLGFRHGVGINRSKGGAQPGAKFEYEMVESGTFSFTVTLRNFALYQLRLILAVLQDINAGLVMFGMGGTRGNGQMILDEGMHLRYKHMGDPVRRFSGYFETDQGGEINPRKVAFGVQWDVDGLASLLEVIGIPDQAALEAAIRAENRELKAAICAENRKLEAANCAISAN